MPGIPWARGGEPRARVNRVGPEYSESKALCSKRKVCLKPGRLLIQGFLVSNLVILLTTVLARSWVLRPPAQRAKRSLTLCITTLIMRVS